MPATKITDLLPIPEGTQQPHAYQVFGLEPGEQDVTKITDAVQVTVTRLKEVKSDTDAKLWNKAAKIVQDARVALADPEMKAKLDARFGIISIEDEPPPPSANPDSQTAQAVAGDPLAGVLPPSDPLAAVLPPSNPMSPATPLPSTPPAPTMPPGVFGSPTNSNVAGGDSPVAPVSVAPAPVAPVVVRPKKARHRKRSVLAMLTFIVFTLGMFALIGVLSYVLLFSSGPIAITKTDGGVSISTKPEAPGQATVTEKEKPPRLVDPVMGDLAGDVPPPTRPSELIGGFEPEDGNPHEFLPPDSSSGPSRTAMSDTEPGAFPVSPAPMPEQAKAEPMTEEMVAETGKAIDRVRILIREANWKEMKQAAESALKLRMTDDQRAEADALYEVADLATYYRGGIQKAVAEMNVGNDFAVTETFRIIVVEKGEDLLVVRYNEKNRSFTFDEFPFSLAHKLAAFSVPEGPTFEAAKAVYQAVAPKATDAHREESLKWLRELGDVEGADPKRMAETIEKLFAGDA